MEQVVYVAAERRERRSLTHRARACESKCRFDIGLTGRPLRSHSSSRSRPHPVPHSPQQAILFLVLLFLGLFTLRSNKLLMNGEYEKDVERSGRGMF